MKVVIYQDLKDEGKHGYSIEEVPDDEKALIAKQMVIPGLYGYEPLHITHLDSGTGLLTIARTNYELSRDKRRSIIKGAIAFYNQVKNNGTNEN